MGNPFQTDLRAFHSDPAIKQRYLERVAARIYAKKRRRITDSTLFGGVTDASL
jgi:hypothetical protein